MASVLLINPLLAYPRRNVWGKVSRPGIPLGLGYLASYLQRAGIEVSILDAHLRKLDAARIAAALPREKPRLIGVTAYTPRCAEAYRVAEVCKRVYSSVEVVAGGPHASAVPDEALETGAIDYVVRGEGEEALLMLAKGQDPSEIPGLSWRRDGKITHSGDARPLQDLDALPFPAYDLLDPRRYGVTVGRAYRSPAASIIASRGCPYSCHFCQAPRLGKSFRIRSAENVLSEMELLKDRYGVLEFAFQDDVLTANRKNLLDLCQLMLRRKLGVSWSCLSRVDNVDREMLSVMKASGCRQVGFGVESGSDDVLRSIGKNTTVDQARTAVRLAKEAGLETVTYFILGLPGETHETIQNTLRLSRELGPDYCLYNIAVPLPGTRLYEEASRDGRLATSDWSRYTASEAILSVPGLSADYIEQSYRRAYTSFYLDPRFLLRRVKKIRSVSEFLREIRIGLELFRL